MPCIQSKSFFEKSHAKIYHCLGLSFLVHFKQNCSCSIYTLK